MLKSAIEKIQEMSKTGIVNVNGRDYMVNGDNYKEILPGVDIPECLELHSLEAMVKMVKTEAMNRADLVYIHVPTHLTAQAYLQPGERQIRSILYEAKATDVPGWDAETKFPFEKAAVALQTRFQDSADRAYTLQLLSQITTGAKVTYNDIGVATTIVTQKGVSLQQNATIKPIVALSPYRTFQEIEQPMGLFLIRIDDRGISFVEADGGMWKLEARKRIKEYLENALSSEIDSERVVVML